MGKGARQLMWPGCLPGWRSCSAAPQSLPTRASQLWVALSCSCPELAEGRNRNVFTVTINDHGRDQASSGPCCLQSVVAPQFYTMHRTHSLQSEEKSTRDPATHAVPCAIPPMLIVPQLHSLMWGTASSPVQAPASFLCLVAPCATQTTVPRDPNPYLPT